MSRRVPRPEGPNRCENVNDRCPSMHPSRGLRCERIEKHPGLCRAWPRGVADLPGGARIQWQAADAAEKG